MTTTLLTVLCLWVLGIAQVGIVGALALAVVARLGIRVFAGVVLTLLLVRLCELSLTYAVISVDVQEVYPNVWWVLATTLAACVWLGFVLRKLCCSGHWVERWYGAAMVCVVACVVLALLGIVQDPELADVVYFLRHPERDGVIY